MKKLICIFTIALALCGCARNYTPIILTDVSYNAVYSMGDFSYLCTVGWDSTTLKLTVNSTKAGGMIITCDGKEVEFDRNGMTKSFLIDDTPATNPALLLYQVFSSLDSAEIEVIDDAYHYTGMTSVGNYILVQSMDNTYDFIEIPNADISIRFTS